MTIKSVEGRFGKVYYYKNDIFVGKSFHHYGEFSGEECEKILELSGDGLCLDIGANIGAIAQMLEFHNKPVVAFEPQKEIYNLLVKNFKGTSHNVALGNYNGTAIMPRVSYGNKGNYGGLSLGTSSVLGKVEVPVHKLDDYLFDKPISFIKIDVEGYEQQVLMGGTKTIMEHRPIMYIEDDRPEKSASLHRYLKELNYSQEMHVTPLFRKNNYFKNPELIWDKYYVSYNLICRPL